MGFNPFSSEDCSRRSREEKGTEREIDGHKSEWWTGLLLSGSWCRVHKTRATVAEHSPQEVDFLSNSLTLRVSFLMRLSVLSTSWVMSSMISEIHNKLNHYKRSSFVITSKTFKCNKTLKTVLVHDPRKRDIQREQQAICESILLPSFCGLYVGFIVARNVWFVCVLVAVAKPHTIWGLNDCISRSMFATICMITTKTCVQTGWTTFTK